MSGHTPGPWTYFIGNANGRGLIRIEADHESPEAGHHIASMPRGERSEADARLIAAAPDLLEVLEWLADLVETDQRGEGPIPLPTYAQIAEGVIKARAIIAKAGGAA